MEGEAQTGLYYLQYGWLKVVKVSPARLGAAPDVIQRALRGLESEGFIMSSLAFAKPTSSALCCRFANEVFGLIG